MLDVKHFVKLGQDQSYINSMRPVIRKKALFSDMTEDYVSPVEPEPKPTFPYHQEVLLLCNSLLLNLYIHPLHPSVQQSFVE